jgi:hypothetical protein
MILQKDEINEHTQVYCTLCKHGEELIRELIKEDAKANIPKSCEECNPWNPEDSCAYEERPNYSPKENYLEHESLVEAQLVGAVMQKLLKKSSKSYCNTCIVGRENPDMCNKCDRRSA